MNYRLFTIIIILLLSFSAYSFNTDTAPRAISPPNGAKFDHYPRSTTFEWEKIDGAKEYILEIDCYHCCEPDHWCSDVNQVYRKITLSETSYTDPNFAGAQSGRWRVRAIDVDNNKTKPSEWRRFEYEN